YGDDTTIKILLFSMFIVLISGFYGHGMRHIFKNYQKNRNDNKLAKHHFKSFKELVIRFKEFTENCMDNIQSVMHNIINSTPPPNPFHQINIIWHRFFEERYKYFIERLNQFDGTKDSLVSLAKEFENILDMYDKLYINDPVKSIRNIERDKVPLQHKESYNKARIKYIDFLNSYNNFAKNANEDLVDKKNDDGFLGHNIIFKDYFAFPEEL
ncbi:MAG: hypothetical protein ACNA7I_08995, partial [Candidatus Methanoperedens sp.]